MNKKYGLFLLLFSASVQTFLIKADPLDQNIQDRLTGKHSQKPEEIITTATSGILADVLNGYLPQHVSPEEERISLLKQQATDIQAELNQKKALFEKDQRRFSEHVAIFSALMEECKENKSLESQACQKLMEIEPEIHQKMVSEMNKD